MSKWETVRLGDICENLDNLRVPITAKDRMSGVYPYYGASGVVDYVNNYIFDEDLLLVSEDGANLLARVTPIAFTIQGKTWVNNHAHVLRFDNFVTQKYVERYLNKIDLSKYITGTAQPKLNQKKLNDILIPLPPLEVQKQIAKTLDTASELIALRKKQLAELDNLIKATFYDIFGDPVINEKGWKRVNLNDIAEEFIGLTYKPEDVLEKGTIVLRSGNIQNDRLDFKDIIRVNKIVKDRLIVRQNDILMCSRNGSHKLVGKTALIDNLDEPMTFGAFMTIIRSKYYNYLLAFFKTEAFRRQLFSSQTTTINQITKAMLDRIELPLPPLALQNQFAEIVTKIEKQKTLVQKAIDESQYMFDSLMSQYFE